MGRPSRQIAPSQPASERSQEAASRGIAAILGIAVVFAGVAYPVTAAALRFTSPSVIATTRALVGGLVMLPVLALVGSRLPRTWRGWAWACAIGTGNVVLTLAGIAEGTNLAGAAIASVLLNSAPFFAALFARVWLDERLAPKQVAGLLIGFTGILLIVSSAHNASGPHVAAGIIVCLSGALGWAAAGLGMRYLTPATSPSTSTAPPPRSSSPADCCYSHTWPSPDRPRPTGHHPYSGPASSSSSSAPKSSPMSASTSPSSTGPAPASLPGRSWHQLWPSPSKPSEATSPTPSPPPAW